MSEATTVKVRKGTPIEVKQFRSDRDSAAARHHELLASIRRVSKAREEQKQKAAITLMKFRKIYDHGRKVTVEAHVAKWSDLWDRKAREERLGK